MKTAEFWHTAEGGKIQCDLCPHACMIADGKTGLCKVRGNEGGELKALGYGFVSSAAIDPIEKKPLYHFKPGTRIFSLGGWGCNFSCAFCQNWTISQRTLRNGRQYSPQEIVAQASSSDSIGIAYTYNEPLVGFEFVRDCVRLAKSAGLANVLVTNGYTQPGPAAEALPFIDALNIDIKSMDDSFYHKQCRGRLEPVLAFAVQAHNAGCHVEITNLVIPGLNDDDEGIAALATWMRDNLGEKTPLHLSAYHPQYKLKISATPLELLERAYGLCRRKLLYVYLGNVATRVGRDTICPCCENALIVRQGYATDVKNIRNGHCGKCGRQADVIS